MGIIGTTEDMNIYAQDIRLPDNYDKWVRMEIILFLEPVYCWIMEYVDEKTVVFLF